MTMQNEGYRLLVGGMLFAAAFIAIYNVATGNMGMLEKAGGVQVVTQGPVDQDQEVKPQPNPPSDVSTKKPVNFPGPLNNPTDPDQVSVGRPLDFPPGGEPIKPDPVGPDGMSDGYSGKYGHHTLMNSANKPDIMTAQASAKASMDLRTYKKAPDAVPSDTKLDLAAITWNQNQRAGIQQIAEGKVIDMGGNGGWYDYNNTGSCDHYCRIIGVDKGMYWSCISPVAPNADTVYTPEGPRGVQCAARFGPAISRDTPKYIEQEQL